MFQKMIQKMIVSKKKKVILSNKRNQLFKNLPAASCATIYAGAPTSPPTCRTRARDRWWQTSRESVVEWGGKTILARFPYRTQTHFPSK